MTSAALTDLQLSIMRALWKVGEGTLAEVMAALADDGKALAPTTVATMLQRLSKQGLVVPTRAGRQFLYRAKLAREEAAIGAVQRVARSFFGGSLSALAAQLLSSDELTSEDIEKMRHLIAKKEV
jgi:BlaI family penicillinase repressor